MCGIAGIVGSFNVEQAQAALTRMLDAQAHRGPDDHGVTVFQVGESTLGLGNRRLAILDLSPLGHQPMRNPDTGDILVYNGEIYNFPELRQTLTACGFMFRGRSDTEVLLRAYEQWGVECLGRLKGMFAFALWDARRRRLVLVRDHLGIKPLYYASCPERGYLFASEVRALLAGGMVPFNIDRRALAGYLAYGAVQEPSTIVEGVQALPRGSWLEVDASGQVAARGDYWDFPAPASRDHRASFHELVEEGRMLLDQAVHRHLLSDVPVGVFLSSGLDSTAVLGVARQVTSDQVHTFTVSFPEDGAQDEGPLARETAQRFNVVHHECQVDESTALQWVEEGLARMDQPTMDGLNTYIVSRAVRREGIMVALSGQGGDEVFGGYRSFRGIPRWYRRMSWLRALAPQSRAALVRLATARMASAYRGKAQDIARTGPDLLGLYFHYRRLLSNADLACLGLRASALNLTDSFHLPESDGRRYLVPNDPVATVGRLESMYYLGNTLLRDADIFGMANSLEIRVPFLDRDLVEWAFQLPGTVLLPNGAPEKFLLREMCANFYTPAQTRQAKRGFTLPFHSWLLGSLQEVMEESLRSVKASGLLVPGGVDRLREVFLREPRSAAWSRVWGVVSLGYWLHTTRPAFAGSVNRT
jgi:asparagine synthase (glutamine-hydrolysing)